MDKQADLRKWFKEKWVDISRKKKGGGHPECGRDDADDGGGYPKCRPAKAAARMSKKQKTHAVRAKRSKPQGVGGKPTMVATFKKKAMFNPEVNNILENLEKEAAKFDSKNNPTHAAISREYWLGTGSREDTRQALMDLAAPKHREAVRKAMDAPVHKPSAKERLRYGAKGAFDGAVLGGAIGALGPNTKKGFKVGAGAGAALLGAGGAIHGGRDEHRFNQVLKAQGLSKKASLNPEVDSILEDLEEMHKEGMFGMGRNSRRAMKARSRARRRRGLDATRNMRRNARVMGATARAEEAGKKFTNPTPKFGYRKSQHMKSKDQAGKGFMSSVGKTLKTPGGAAIGAGLAGAAIGAATAKPKTVTTTAPDGTKTTTTQKPNRMGRALAAGAGAGLAAGGARLAMKKMASAETDNILSFLDKEAAKKPQVLPKAGFNMVAPVLRDPNKRSMSPSVRKAGIGAGVGAAAGAIRGAVKNPGTNEDGTKKSRLKAIARNAAGGAALGGAAGAGVSAANNRGYSVGLKPKS